MRIFKVKMKSRILLFIILLLVSSLSLAQSGEPEEVVQNIKSQYELGNIYEAEVLALKALNSNIAFTPAQRSEIHKYLAFCYVAMGERENAVQEFINLLKLTPDHRFNPKLISPKVIEVFNIALERYQELLKQVVVNPEPNFHFKRIEASKRSLLFPGLGQLYKGEEQKGYILMGGEVTVLVSLVLFQWQYDKAHEAYLNASIQSDIQDKYDTYNLYYKLRNFSAVSAVLIYLYSYYDCVYIPSTGEERSVSVHFSPAQFSVTISF